MLIYLLLHFTVLYVLSLSFDPNVKAPSVALTAPTLGDIEEPFNCSPLTKFYHVCPSYLEPTFI
jgi:hypothetical protein